MRSEALKKRITIQQQSTTQDSFGSPIDTWTTVATVWASIEPINGKEFFAASQVNAEVTTRIRIRYLSGIEPAMRVLYGTRLYNIQSVIDYKESHAEMQLMCKEVI